MHGVMALMRYWALQHGLIPTQAFGFDHVMTLNMLCTYTCALANQAIHPFWVSKLVPTICPGINACGDVLDMGS